MSKPSPDAGGPTQSSPPTSRNCLFPPGHFYSPVPDVVALANDEERIFAPVTRGLPGIDLNAETQLATVARFRAYYPDIPWQDERAEGLRYFFRNPAYSYTDAIFLYSMIRDARPRKVIEIGSGFSSCVILDTNERFFSNTIECRFVEPFPQLLRSLLKAGDVGRITVDPCRVQDLAPEVFSSLDAGDLLIIDSTHVSKTGSDVNFIFFEVLPYLRPGVRVHFHDIFYPFEYPKKWVMQGRAWNESYLLRAFLHGNSGYSIELFASYLARFHRAALNRALPRCAENYGGNIWLRRTDA